MGASKVQRGGLEPDRHFDRMAVTTHWQRELTCFQDALVRHISLLGFFQYSIRFSNTSAVEEFSKMVSLCECSRTPNGASGISADAERALKGLVLELGAYQWDDEENAFTEIDMLTSTFALLHGTI